MTKLLKNIVVFIFIVVIVAGSVLAGETHEAKSVKELEEYMLEEMLIYVIQEKYLAQAGYEAIMGEYGEQKPFSNIMKSEESHIEELLPLFAKYNIEVPANDASEHVILAESIEKALENGVKSETNNIAIYEMFLERGLPEEVRAVFVELKESSEKHLEAFKRGTERGQHNYGKGEDKE